MRPCGKWRAEHLLLVLLRTIEALNGIALVARPVGLPIPLASLEVDDRTPCIALVILYLDQKGVKEKIAWTYLKS
jgi:hypothetical protein